MARRGRAAGVQRGEVADGRSAGQRAPPIRRRPDRAPAPARRLLPRCERWAKRHAIACLNNDWRRGRDWNPRSPCGDAGFQDSPVAFAQELTPRNTRIIPTHDPCQSLCFSVNGSQRHWIGNCKSTGPASQKRTTGRGRDRSVLKAASRQDAYIDFNHGTPVPKHGWSPGGLLRPAQAYGAFWRRLPSCWDGLITPSK